MKPQRLETRLCFAPGSICGADIAELLERHLLGFQPRFVHGRQLAPRQRALSKADVRTLGRLETPEAIFLSAGRGFGGENSFSVSLHPGKDVQAITWTLPRGTQPPPEALLELLQRPGFNAGLAFDADDGFWQSLADMNTFRALGGRPEGLRLRMDPEFPEREVIDTRHNPGRLELFPGMWMGAAWRVYLGPRAIALVGRDRLLSFDSMFSREVIDSGVIVMTLFQDPHEAQSAAARDTQERFRQWLRLDEIFEATSDTSVDEGGLLIEEGRFPHGGVRRLTARYDSEGRLSRRLAAVREETFELDEGGGILWRSGDRPVRGATS